MGFHALIKLGDRPTDSSKEGDEEKGLFSELAVVEEADNLEEITGANVIGGLMTNDTAMLHSRSSASASGSREELGILADCVGLDAFQHLDEILGWKKDEEKVGLRVF